VKLKLTSYRCNIRGSADLTAAEGIEEKRVHLESKIGSQGQMLFEPQNLVFREDPSTLYAANGKKLVIEASWVDST